MKKRALMQQCSSTDSNFIIRFFAVLFVFLSSLMMNAQPVISSFSPVSGPEVLQ